MQNIEIKNVKPLLQQHIVVCSALSTEDWRRLAIQIDNSFTGSEKTFSAERKIGYYFLSTNKCDDASFIRVYCEVWKSGIDKITILGEHTESWEEIHPNTYSNVEKFLNGLVS